MTKDEEGDDLKRQMEVLREGWEKSARSLEARLDELSARKRGAIANPGAAAVLAALVGLISGALGAYFQSRSPVDVEKVRFESSLILDALKAETTAEAAKRLDFLVRAKLIDGREGAIEKLVSEPEDLPIRTREMRLRDAQVEVGCPKDMVFDAGTFRCVAAPEPENR